MANNITLNSGSGGASLAADDVANVWYQRIKLTDGAEDATTPIIAGGGAEAAGALLVTLANDSTGLLSVDDNGAALTVDWAGTAPPIGAGLEATALRVTVATDSTGVLTVDGTVTANLSATDNAVLDTINTAVVATQAAVEGTLTVGSHAVTNAGTFATQVDGAALTALQLIDDIIFTDDTSTHATGTTKGAGIMAAATPTDTAVAANDIGMLAMSLDRRLHVDADITASVALDVSGATVTVDLGANNDVTVTSGTVTANLSATDNAVLDAIAASVAGTLTVAAHAVTNAGTFATQAAATLQAGTALVGDVGLGVRTSGGATPFYNLDVDETEDAVKASAGQLYELYCNNTTAAQLFVKIYDATVATVVVGTTTPVMTIPVPANADLDGAGVVRSWPMGLAFATAITIAATTGAADNDAGTPSAGAVIVSGAYA